MNASYLELLKVWFDNLPHEIMENSTCRFIKGNNYVDKVSVSVQIENEDKICQVDVWETGEYDIRLYSVVSGDPVAVINKSSRFSNRSDFEEEMSQLMSEFFNSGDTTPV